MRAIRCRRRATVCSLGFALAWLSVAVCVAQPSDDGWLPTRFRVTLQSESSLLWRGELSLDAGRLERLQPLRTEPAIAAGASIHDGRVELHHRKAWPNGWDAFDVTARCPPGARLQLRLEGADEIATIDIDAARDATQSRRIESAGATISLERGLSDRLRVETERRSLVFDPGDDFEFGVLFDPGPESRGEPIDLVATLSRGRDGDAVWNAEPQRRQASPDGRVETEVSVPIPAEEGIYRVTLEARRPSGFLRRFGSLPGIAGGGDAVLSQRTFQLLVFDRTKRPAAPGDWRTVYEFDPRIHRWADRVPDWMRWRRLPWFDRGPISSDGKTDLAAERRGAIEIPQAGPDAAPWRAYPLPIDEVGATYAVELEALGDPGSQLTVAVIEPDALGDFRSVGPAVTHVRSRWSKATRQPPLRLMVRPHTTSALLVVANPDESKPARFGSIRLLKSTGVERGVSEPERLVALDWPDANLPRAVGASHRRAPGDADPGYDIADLQTFYDTAAALADRVEAAGANAAVIPVNRAGAAIFPSRLWPSPNFDRGVWTDGAADLPRAELLTLIAAELERRDLSLIPTLRFDAPTPVIERMGAGYAPGSPLTHRTCAVAIREMLDTLKSCDNVAAVAIRVSPKGWALPDEASEDQGDRVADGFTRVSRSLQDAGVDGPLLLLSGEITQRPRVVASLTPRLGDASQASEQGIAGSAVRFLIGRSNAVITPAPFGGVPGSLEADALSRLRRCWPESRATEAISVKSTRGSIRLAASAQRLGSRSGEDIRVPTVTVAPQLEAERLAEATAGATSLVLLDGAGSVGLLSDRATESRSLLGALPPAPQGSAAEPSDLVGSIAVDQQGAGLARITNQSAWPRRAQLTVTANERIRGRELYVEGAEQWFEPGRHAIDVELDPYATAVWRFSSGEVSLDGVRTAPAQEAQRELAEALADLQGRDTSVRRPASLVRNPSFESADSQGAAESWRGSGAASRDLTDAVDGAASFRLSSTAEIPASLESDPFPAPSTGQLVVLLQVRPIEVAPDSELRIDLIDTGSGYRRTTRLATEQLSATSTDAWSLPVLFPNDDLPVRPGARMQLRFTLTGDAEIGIDDVRTEDLVLPLDGFGPIEMRGAKFALVRMITTAEKLLAEGRLEACRKVLDSYWPRFLQRNFPPQPIEPLVNVPADAEPTTDEELPEESEASPSIGSRLKGYLPRWWR